MGEVGFDVGKKKYERSSEVIGRLEKEMLFMSEASRNSGRQGWGKAHCGQGIEDQDKTRQKDGLYGADQGLTGIKLISVLLF